MSPQRIHPSATLVSAFAIVLCASIAPAADREIEELQREVAIINDQVKSLQTSLDSFQSSVNDKLAAQGALMQQTLDRANQIHTENAVSASAVADQLRDQEQKIVTPVASLSAKLDQMISQFSATQDNLADMTSRLARLEQKISDLENAVKVIQAGPAPAPPAQGGGPNGLTADGLYQSASGDQLSGKSSLALQEYRDYLQYFGDTEMASSAQFHIGEILMSQGNLDDAVQAFGALLDQYPKSPRAPDALYLKALVLERQGKRALAIQALNEALRRYPGSDAAGNAKTELARLRRPRK